jgi:protein-disulfide isomerase
VPQTKRAAAKRPTRASNLRTFYLILALVGVAGIGWITYSLVGGGGSAVVDPIQLTGLEDPQALFDAAKGVTLGEANAPVQVLVFSDFTCPACKVWSTRVEPELKKEFVETGKVKLVYYDFPLGRGAGHDHGFIAARAARCAADQNKFWELHDVLFARQSEWTFERSTPLEKFAQYAREVGLDEKNFEACLNSDLHAKVVTANRMLGDNLSVPGTPTVYVGSRPVGQWSDYAAVREAVQRELGS